MASKDVTLARIQSLAATIERHIRQQNLAPDSPYLTDAEICKLFGVHSRVAKGALNVLADRHVLVHRRGVGMFVGPAVVQRVMKPVVHVLTSARRFDHGCGDTSFPMDIIAAVGRHLPATSVQFNVLQGSGTVADAQAALALTLDSALACGVILNGCGRALQEYVQGLKIPAVVFGGTFATTEKLCSVDADQSLMGQLLAEHLLSRGHRRISVLMHETWLPGDNRYFEAVSSSIAAAGATCMVRSLPLDAAALRAEAHMLAMGTTSTTAVICRSRQRYEMLTQALTEASAELKTAVPIEAVFDDFEFHGSMKVPYACIAVPMAEQAEKIAEQLAAVSRGIAPSATILPVELVQPGN